MAFQQQRNAPRLARSHSAPAVLGRSASIAARRAGERRRAKLHEDSVIISPTVSTLPPDLDESGEPALTSDDAAGPADSEVPLARCHSAPQPSASNASRQKLHEVDSVLAAPSHREIDVLPRRGDEDNGKHALTSDDAAGSKDSEVRTRQERLPRTGPSYPLRFNKKRGMAQSRGGTRVRKPRKQRESAQLCKLRKQLAARTDLRLLMLRARRSGISSQGLLDRSYVTEKIWRNRATRAEDGSDLVGGYSLVGESRAEVQSGRKEFGVSSSVQRLRNARALMEEINYFRSTRSFGKTYVYGPERYFGVSSSDDPFGKRDEDHLATVESEIAHIRQLIDDELDTGKRHRKGWRKAARSHHDVTTAAAAVVLPVPEESKSHRMSSVPMRNFRRANDRLGTDFTQFRSAIFERDRDAMEREWRKVAASGTPQQSGVWGRFNDGYFPTSITALDVAPDVIRRFDKSAARGKKVTRLVWHGTSAKNTPSIAKRGLMSGTLDDDSVAICNGDMYGNGIYAATTPHCELGPVHWGMRRDSDGDDDDDGEPDDTDDGSDTGVSTWTCTMCSRTWRRNSSQRCPGCSTPRPPSARIGYKRPSRSRDTAALASGHMLLCAVLDDSGVPVSDLKAPKETNPWRKRYVNHLGDTGLKRPQGEDTHAHVLIKRNDMVLPLYDVHFEHVKPEHDVGMAREYEKHERCVRAATRRQQRELARRTKSDGLFVREGREPDERTVAERNAAKEAKKALATARKARDTARREKRKAAKKAKRKAAKKAAAKEAKKSLATLEAEGRAKAKRKATKKVHAPGTDVLAGRYPGVVQSYDAVRKTYDIIFDDGDRHRNFRQVDVRRGKKKKGKNLWTQQ